MTSRPVGDVVRDIRTGLFRKRMTVDDLRAQIAKMKEDGNQEFSYVESQDNGDTLAFVQYRPAAPTTVRRGGSLTALKKLWDTTLDNKAVAETTAVFRERQLRNAPVGDRSRIEHEMRAAQNRAHQLGAEMRAFREHGPKVDKALLPHREAVEQVEARFDEWVSDPQGFVEASARPHNELDNITRCAMVCFANYETPKGNSAHGERPHDVQIAALLALDGGPVKGRLDFLELRSRLPRGVVVEMLTGEGKTLVARLWALKQALDGGDVVVMTHNSTLAESAVKRTEQVGARLGLTVRLRPESANTRAGVGHSEPDGFLGVPKPPPNLHEIYEANVVYGSAREIVGDWQRGLGDQTQRFGQRHVLMDEVDMLAIDWGRTAYRLGEQIPGTVGGGADMYAIAELARVIRNGEFSLVEGRVWISPEQAKAFAKRIGLGGELTARHTAQLAEALNAGLRHRPNREYIRDGDNNLIVDQDNGDAMPGSLWYDHRWVDALEGTTIKAPLRTLSEKTLIDYLHSQLSYRGVTGTAKSAEKVLRDVYDLDVVQMAPNDPRRLAELPRRVFADNPALQRSVAEEILEAHRRGDARPILVLMRDIADTQAFAKMLKEVLATGPNPVVPRTVDARTPNKLYELIAESEAGKPFAVTVATAKFGRGTDINLGGEPHLPGCARRRPRHAARRGRRARRDHQHVRHAPRRRAGRRSLRPQRSAGHLARVAVAARPAARPVRQPPPCCGS